MIPALFEPGLCAHLAAAELRLRFGALLRGVRAAVARRDARIEALAHPELAHLSVTAQHAQVLLAEAEGFVARGRAYGPGTALTWTEQDQLVALHERAGAAGLQLPGAILTERGLSGPDLELLVLTAAPALDPTFGALYGYLNDLRSCSACTPTLAADVLATDADHEQQVLTACGPYGTLRADGWVIASQVDRGVTTLLRPAEGVLELLIGASVDAGLLGRERPLTMARPSPAAAPPVLPDLAAAFQAGRVDVVGLWGPERSGQPRVVAALAGDRPLLHMADSDGAADIEVALQRAALNDAVCVLAVPANPVEAVQLAERVARSRVPTILVCSEPLRVPELMQCRQFAELSLPTPTYADRRRNWSEAFPHLDPAGVDDLAGRFRLLPEEIEAVARLDATCASWATNGDRPAVGTLAGVVSRRRSPQVAAIRTPRRGLDLLVLPASERAQVLEVAAAARAWPRVADAWRLDRFGNPGIVALFTGEPGTGKTMAAEVVAFEIGLDLMEVDLSRLVSKWLGETEKHLDAVFTEAEASNCVLFFDEADSIFGQRGEVTRGSDRYANLEVGYLLQRLERFEGLAILASNLRANLDPAFTRRFHHVVHFPRPAEAERHRLWQIALGPPVELAEPIDLDILAGIDLTGASIAAIIRCASLAADGPDGPASLTAADLITATRKQFQREARLPPSEQFGMYARLL